MPSSFTTLLEGTMPRGRKREAELHLDGCADCAETLAMIVRSDRPASREEEAELARIPEPAPRGSRGSAAPGDYGSTPRTGRRDGMEASPRGGSHHDRARSRVVADLHAKLASRGEPPHRHGDAHGDGRAPPGDGAHSPALHHRVRARLGHEERLRRGGPGGRSAPRESPERGCAGPGKGSGPDSRSSSPRRWPARRGRIPFPAGDRERPGLRRRVERARRRLL